MAKPNISGNGNENAFPAKAQGKAFAAHSAESATSGPILSRRRCGVRLVGGGLETGGWIVYGDPHPEYGSSGELRERAERRINCEVPTQGE